MTDPTAILTPISQRIPPAARYRRLPSALFPEPIIPERVILPGPDIHHSFAIQVAIDDAAEADAFSVRWQVYCQELGYEPADRFPDRRERDSADQRSVQVLAYHRASGRPAGAFRLLMADPADPAAPFHLEEVCPLLDPGSVPRDPARRLGCAELSRFCILPDFRRFDAGCQDPPWGIEAGRWHAEAIHRRGLAGLMWLAAAQLVVSLRLDWLLALTEPRLQALARCWGFAFAPIGRGIEFRGLRQPYRIDRRALRALLHIPQGDALLAPLATGIERDARRHPLLQAYFRDRTAVVRR